MAGAPKKRAKREREGVLQQEAERTMASICLFVAGGGTLSEWCHENDVRYGSTYPWITSDPEREAQLKAAVACRDAHSRDSVVHTLKAIEAADYGEAFDPETGALLPVREMPANVRQSIVSFKVVELFETVDGEKILVGYLKEVRLADKTKAAEVLARTQRMLSDKVEHEGRVTLEQLIGEANKQARELERLPMTRDEELAFIVPERLPARIPNPQDADLI